MSPNPEPTTLTVEQYTVLIAHYAHDLTRPALEVVPYSVRAWAMDTRLEQLFGTFDRFSDWVGATLRHRTEKAARIVAEAVFLAQVLPTLQPHAEDRDDTAINARLEEAWAKHPALHAAHPCSGTFAQYGRHMARRDL